MNKINDEIYTEYGCGSQTRYGESLSIEEIVWLSLYKNYEFNLDDKIEEIKKNSARIALYCHLRSEGAYLRDGLSFGCEFLYYLDHPQRSHSSYLVYNESSDPLTIQRRIRAANTALKTVIFAKIENDEIEEINDIKKAKITLRVIKPGIK